MCLSWSFGGRPVAGVASRAGVAPRQNWRLGNWEWTLERPKPRFAVGAALLKGRAIAGARLEASRLELGAAKARSGLGPWRLFSDGERDSIPRRESPQFAVAADW